MTNEQAIEVINGHIEDSCIAYGTFTGQALRMAIKALKAQSEQKTNVWLTYTNIPQYMLCKCSACGADVLVPYLGKNTIFNYCPNCGVKMEGDLI